MFIVFFFTLIFFFSLHDDKIISLCVKKNKQIKFDRYGYFLMSIFQIKIKGRETCLFYCKKDINFYIVAVKILQQQCLKIDVYCFG